MSSVFTGLPLRSLVCQTLLSKLPFFCFFSAVQLLLPLCLFHGPPEKLLAVWMRRRSQTSQMDQLLPGAKPLRQKLPPSSSSGQGVYP